MTQTQELAPPSAAAPDQVVAGSLPRAILHRTVVSIATLLASAAVLAVLWIVVLKVLGVSSFVGKTPADVWHYLFSGPSAGAHRSVIGSGLVITLHDSAVGFVAGLVAAMIVAAAFTVIPVTEFVFMPLAMLLRSVPLVAMAPLIGLIFGRGLGGAAAIGGVIVFFPALVNVTLGLRSASPQSVDLIRAYGGGQWTVLRKVAIPSALPNLFASIRISVPGSVIGAMLYEWLFSAKGLGADIFRAQTSLGYNQVWAIVVVVTGTSIVIYTLVSILETAALAAWGPNAGRV